MRKYIWLCLCFLALGLNIPLLAAEPRPAFLVMDQGKDLVEMVNPDFKTAFTFHAGPKPSAVIPAADHTGYYLMYRGDAKQLTSRGVPGGILRLDSSGKPAGQILTFTGLVLRDFYLPATQKWILITSKTPDSKVPGMVITMFDLQNGAERHWEFEATPAVYQFNPDQTRLAVATAGESNKKIAPQLILLNLVTLEAKTYPLATPNPGAIFFPTDRQIVVACGGYRSTKHYIDGFLADKPDHSVPASLDWIDLDQSKVVSTSVGYSTLVVRQDLQEPQTFYTAAMSTAEPQGTAWVEKIVAGQVLAKAQVPAEPIGLFKASNGNFWFIGRQSSFVLDQNFKTIASFSLDQKVDKFILGPDGLTGYLTTENYGFLQKVDLSTGKQTQIKLGNSNAFGLFSLNDIFSTALPPVIGAPLTGCDRPDYKSPDRSLFFADDQKLIYTLWGSTRISSIDWQNNTVQTVYYLPTKATGIQSIPHSPFFVVSGNDAWYLIDPKNPKPLLQLNFTRSENSGITNVTPNAPAGFYSSDGHWLVVQDEENLYLVDCLQGKYLRRLLTKTKDPVIAWMLP